MIFLPGFLLSDLLCQHEEDEESGGLQVHCLVLLLSGLRLRLGGVYRSDRAHGGASLGDCAHPEDHEEEAEGMEDLEVEITV